MPPLRCASRGSAEFLLPSSGSNSKCRSVAVRRKLLLKVVVNGVILLCNHIIEALVHLEAAQQCTVFGLHVMGKNFNCEKAHSVFLVELFKFALHHDVKGLEKQLVKMLLHFLFRLGFFEFAELLRCHPYPHVRPRGLPIRAVPCSLAKFT